MPAYSKGDRVEAKSDIVRVDKTFTKGSKGKVTSDSSARIAVARVKFNGDSAMLFRIVPKSKIKKI